jgi:hypothetical protein
MLSAPERLNAATQSALADSATELWLSVASAWEVAIKHARGKLPLHHHNDPFDRVLVAQAQLEGMTLVTADEIVARYGATVLGLRDERGKQRLIRSLPESLSLSSNVGGMAHGRSCRCRTCGSAIICITQRNALVRCLRTIVD